MESNGSVSKTKEAPKMRGVEPGAHPPHPETERSTGQEAGTLERLRFLALHMVVSSSGADTASW